MLRTLVLVGLVLRRSPAAGLYILVHEGSKATPATAPAEVRCTLARASCPVRASTPMPRPATSGPRSARSRSAAGSRRERSWSSAAPAGRPDGVALLEAAPRGDPRARDAVRPLHAVAAHAPAAGRHRRRGPCHAAGDAVASRTAPGRAVWTQRYRVNGISTVSRNRSSAVNGSGQAGVRRDRRLRRDGRPSGHRARRRLDRPSSGLDLRETIDRRIGGAFPYEMHVDVRFSAGTDPPRGLGSDPRVQAGVSGLSPSRATGKLET